MTTLKISDVPVHADNFFARKNGQVKLFHGKDSDDLAVNLAGNQLKKLTKIRMILAPKTTKILSLNSSGLRNSGTLKMSFVNNTNEDSVVRLYIDLQNQKVILRDKLSDQNQKKRAEKQYTYKDSSVNENIVISKNYYENISGIYSIKNEPVKTESYKDKYTRVLNPVAGFLADKKLSPSPPDSGLCVYPEESYLKKNIAQLFTQVAEQADAMQKLNLLISKQHEKNSEELLKRLLEKNHYDFLVEHETEMQDVSRQYFGWQRFRAAVGLFLPSASSSVLGVSMVTAVKLGLISAALGSAIATAGTALAVVGGIGAIIYVARRVGTVDWLMRKVVNEKEWLPTLLKIYKGIQRRDNKTITEFSKKIPEYKNQDLLSVYAWIVVNAESYDKNPLHQKITTEFNRKTLGRKFVGIFSKQKVLKKTSENNQSLAPVLSPEILRFLKAKQQIQFVGPAAGFEREKDVKTLGDHITHVDDLMIKEMKNKSGFIEVENTQQPLQLAYIGRSLDERVAIYKQAKAALALSLSEQQKEKDNRDSIDSMIEKARLDLFSEDSKKVLDEIQLWLSDKDKKIPNSVAPYKIEAHLCSAIARLHSQEMGKVSDNAKNNYEELLKETAQMISGKRHPYFHCPARKPILSVESAERIQGLLQTIAGEIAQDEKQFPDHVQQRVSIFRTNLSSGG